MRTYSLTVPLVERTLTIRGYMISTITTSQVECQAEIERLISRFSRQNVTTLFGPQGSSRLKNKDLRRAGGAETSNMG